MLRDRSVFLLLFVLPSFALLGVSCTAPLGGSIPLIPKQVKQVTVGYNKTTYAYPIQVPGSTQTVWLVTNEPLNNPPDYEDFLAWQKAGKAPAKSTTEDPQTISKSQQLSPKH